LVKKMFWLEEDSLCVAVTGTEGLV
jgi:hypothetical protein